MTINKKTKLEIMTELKNIEDQLRLLRWDVEKYDWKQEEINGVSKIVMNCRIQLNNLENSVLMLNRIGL